MTTVSCAPRAEAVAGIFAAAQQDMEFHSRLAVARHYLENLLAGFSATVAAADPERMAALLRGARLIAEESDGNQQELTPQGTVGWLAPAGRTAVVTTNNLSLSHDGPNIRYTGTFQCWTSESLPQCAAFGTFHGLLVAGPQVWRWSEHVIRFPSWEAESTAC